MSKISDEVRRLNRQPVQHPQLRQQQQQPEEEESPDVGFGTALGDAALGAGAGVTGMVQGAVGLGSLLPGMDAVTTPAYEGLGSAREWMQDQQSEATQQAREQVHGAWDEGDGFWDSTGETLSAIRDNPYYLLGAGSEAAGSIGGFGAGLRALGTAGRFARMSQPAQVGSLAAGLGTGTVAGEIASEDPDGYFNRFASLGAGAVYGATAGLGARVGGALDPKTVAGRLAGARLPTPGQAAGAGTGSASAALPLAGSHAAVRYPAYTAAGATNEAVQEFAQSGSDVLFANLGLGRETWEGVGQAAVLGAVSGAVGGGATSTLAGRADQKTQDLLKRERDIRAGRATEETGSQFESGQADAASTTTQLPEALDSFADRFVPEGARDAVRDEWSRHRFDQELSTPDGAVDFLHNVAPLTARTKENQGTHTAAKKMRQDMIQYMFIRATEGMDAPDAQQASQFARGILNDASVPRRLQNARGQDDSAAALAEVYGELQERAQSRVAEAKRQRKEAMESLQAVGAEGSEQGQQARARMDQLQQEEVVLNEVTNAMRALKERTARVSQQQEEQSRTVRNENREAAKNMAAHLTNQMGIDERAATDIQNQLDQGDGPQSMTEAFTQLSERVKLSPQNRRGRPRKADRRDITAATMAEMHVAGSPEASAAAEQFMHEVLTEGTDAPAEGLLPTRDQGFANTEALEQFTQMLEQRRQRNEDMKARVKLTPELRKGVDQEIARLNEQVQIARAMLAPYQQQRERMRQAGVAGQIGDMGQMSEAAPATAQGRLSGPAPQPRLTDFGPLQGELLPDPVDTGPPRLGEPGAQGRLADLQQENAGALQPPQDSGVMAGAEGEAPTAMTDADVWQAQQRVQDMAARAEELGLTPTRVPADRAETRVAGQPGRADQQPVGTATLERMMRDLSVVMRNPPENLRTKAGRPSKNPSITNLLAAMREQSDAVDGLRPQQHKRLRDLWIERANEFAPVTPPTEGRSRPKADGRAERRAQARPEPEATAQQETAAQQPEASAQPTGEMTADEVVNFLQSLREDTTQQQEETGEVARQEVDWADETALDDLSMDDLFGLFEENYQAIHGDESGDGSWSDTFNLATRRPQNPLNPAVAQQAVDQVLPQFPGAPGVVVVENYRSEAMPQSARDIFAQAHRSGRPIKGVYHRGEIYIDPRMHESPADVARTVYHEVVGHHGLRGAMGDQINDVLDSVADARSLDLLHYAEKYDLDLTDTQQRREAAEEMIAAQSERLAEQGTLAQLFDWVRAFWHDLTGQEYTDAQIARDLLAPARGFVATRNSPDLVDQPPSDRYRKPGVPDPANTPQLNDPDVLSPHSAQGTYRDWIGELANRAKTNLMFTHSLIGKLERRLASARDFRRAWDTQQRLAVDWERFHQTIGQKYTKLGQRSHERVSKALLHYSSTGNMPYLLNHAKTLTYADPGDGSGVRIVQNDLSEADVVLDRSRFDNLNAKEQEVVELALETMAQLQMSQTELKVTHIQRAIGQMREAGRQTEAELQQIEREALQAIVSQHNVQATKAYVPQTRRGKFRVIARSQELERQRADAEQRGEDPDLVPLARDRDHYEYLGAETQADAISLMKQKREEGWSATYEQTPPGQFEDNVTLGDLTRQYHKLLQRQHEDGDNAPLLLSQEIEQEMLQEINKLRSEANTVAQSQMPRENVPGVQWREIVPNVLDRTRDFGYHYAASVTAPQRSQAMMGMRRELSQLTGRDNVEYMQTFTELLERANDVREGDHFGDKAARGALQFSSFQYLLSNPSYYALQLTQPWMMSVPTMAGEFGIAKTATKMAESYSQMKDVVKAISVRETELNFDSVPEEQRLMLQELQARNSLDVGMSQEYGVPHGTVARNAATKTMGTLYNAARGVELINRSATALAAYDLRMEQLLRGRDRNTLDADTLQNLRERATDYADHIVFRTHGNYSYADSPGIFRNPIMRVMLQFKKIALIQAELMYSLGKKGWAPTKLSERATQFLARPEMGVDAGTLQQLQDGRLITQEQFDGLYDRVRTASQDQQVLNQMSARDQQFFHQLLNAELHPDTFVTYEVSQASRASMRWLLGTSAVMTGANSIPFATAALALAMRKMDLGDPDEQDEFETDAGTITRVLGPDMGSFVLRGTMGNAVGIDVSNRIGINFVDHMFGALYNDFSVADSESTVMEAAYGFAGPSVNYVGDFVKGLNYMQQHSVTGSHHDLVKGLSSFAPLGIRNYMTASLWDRQGLVSDSRLQMIDPEEFSDGQIVGKRFGFQPSMISEFYDVREHMHEVQQGAEHKRLLLKRSYYEAMQEGDSERAAQVTEQWRDLQSDQRTVGIPPSPLSELQQFVRQKRREQQRSVAGMPTTSRNRELARRLGQQHGVSDPMDMTPAQRLQLMRQGINPFQAPPESP